MKYDILQDWDNNYLYILIYLDHFHYSKLNFRLLFVCLAFALAMPGVGHYHHILSAAKYFQILLTKITMALIKELKYSFILFVSLQNTNYNEKWTWIYFMLQYNVHCKAWTNGLFVWIMNRISVLLTLRQKVWI